MKIYSYVVRYDDGVAPNPFWGYCTLAICKPDIRRVAKKDDWVIGTGSKENVGNDRLVYAMKITEPPLQLAKYRHDQRFAKKIPVGKVGIQSLGDNIYYMDESGQVRQRFPSAHSDNCENEKTKTHDLKGKNVLISEEGNFYYFGGNAPKIPEHLLCVVKKYSGHKWNFPQDIVNSFLTWIQEWKTGIHGYPYGYSRESRTCNRLAAKCSKYLKEFNGLATVSKR